MNEMRHVRSYATLQLMGPSFDPELGLPSVWHFIQMWPLKMHEKENVILRYAAVCHAVSAGDASLLGQIL